jgi:tRNA-modifying protein YgfZ
VNPAPQPFLFSFRPAACLHVSGSDAETFLQGQFTNDLRSAGTDRAVYGLWLNQKGKVLADSFILRAANQAGFWLVSYFSPAAVIRERLEAYVIADDVTIDDVTATHAGVSIIGSGARQWLERHNQAKIDHNAGWWFAGRRSREENIEWIFPVENLAAVKSRLVPAHEWSALEVERARIEAGIPAVPIDIGPGDLPNEGGLEIDAISFTKGCYLGQEVMARLKSMGQVRRRLLRVSDSSGQVPALPAPLFVGDKKAGELRSAVADGAGGFVGLALLSLLQLQPETALALAPQGASTIRWSPQP